MTSMRQMGWFELYQWLKEWNVYLGFCASTEALLEKQLFLFGIFGINKGSNVGDDIQLLNRRTSCVVMKNFAQQYWDS